MPLPEWDRHYVENTGVPWESRSWRDGNTQLLEISCTSFLSGAGAFDIEATESNRGSIVLGGGEVKVLIAESEKNNERM